MLKQWMEERGLSLSELARTLGVSRQAVQQWVKGSSYPSTPVLAQLEKISEGRITARSFVDG